MIVASLSGAAAGVEAATGAAAVPLDSTGAEVSAPNADAAPRKPAARMNRKLGVLISHVPF